MPSPNSNVFGYVVMAAVAVISIAALVYFMQPTRTTPQERVGNAIEEVQDGFKDAGRALDPDRTPAERVGDAVKDLGDDIKDTAR